MRKLILAVMLSVLLLGFGTSYAGTASIENVPGGAGIAYFQVGQGWQTLFNVQNVADNSTVGCSAAILVHVVLYDKFSAEIVNFNVPLSQNDNWGASMTLAGNVITVTPQACPAALPNSPGMTDAGCAPHSGIITVDSDGIAFGYITAAITEMDCGLATPQIFTTTNFALGNNDGNPWNDTNMTGLDVVSPNWIFMRTAIVNPGFGFGFAMNGRMIQHFLNIGAIAELAGVDWVDTLPVPDNTICPWVDWNNNLLGDILAFNGTDDFNGIRIDTWELYATLILDTDPAAGVTTAGTIIVDNCNLTASRAGRHSILGSANNWYWARFNETPGITETTLITVAPAATGPGNVGANPMLLNGSVFDDNEAYASVTITPLEAARCPFVWVPAEFTTACAVPAAGITHSTFTTGEFNFFFRNPMYGFSYTATANFADLYPIVNEEVAVVLTNIQPQGGFPMLVMTDLPFPLDVQILFPLVSDVGRIGAWH
ncbi:MAG: hypothetical protein FJ240_11660 [Nitrospira sp.]|nr:hypothetical protein [Nitrospira sp.]